MAVAVAVRGGVGGGWLTVSSEQAEMGRGMRRWRGESSVAVGSVNTVGGRGGGRVGGGGDEGDASERAGGYGR